MGSAASYLALDGCHIAEPKQYTILWTFRNFNRLLRTANFWTLWRLTSYNTAKEPTANNRILILPKKLTLKKIPNYSKKSSWALSQFCADQHINNFFD